MNTNKLYVANIAYSASENDLRDYFAQHGSVEGAHLVMDRATNKSRGFGFVTMATPDEAETALNALNGSDFHGRPLVVREARPKPQD